VKKDTLSLAVVTAIGFFADGRKKYMSWVNMIYYCLIACLVTEDCHPVRSGSAPDFVKHALWRGDAERSWPRARMVAMSAGDESSCLLLE